MKTLVLDNILSKEEVHFLYHDLIGNSNWQLWSLSDPNHAGSKTYQQAPMYRIHDAVQNVTYCWPMYYYFKSIIFRIRSECKKRNIGVPKNMFRAFVNGTYSENRNNWLHVDGDHKKVSCLIFLTPTWETGWKGSFYVDGEEYKFEPGNIVIFDSKNYHTGEAADPASKNWLRLTANIILSDE